MRLLAKLVRWALTVGIVLAIAQSLLLWNAARRDYASATAQVAAAIEGGHTVLTLSDVPALRHLPANIADMERLTWLKARDTQLYDLTALEGRYELEFLDILGTRVSDLEPLRGLPNLRHIQINRTRVRDLEPLTTLPALERVGMSFVQVASLEPLLRAPGLNWLNLHGAYSEDGGQEHHRLLSESGVEVNNGRAIRMNYVPDESWLWRVKMNRLAEDWGLPEPFPRGT